MLTSKLFKARGHWLQQVAQREQQLETTDEDLRKKRLVVAAARDDVNRLMNLWGNSWPSAQNQIVNPQQGAIAIKVGGNAGIARREFAAQTQLPAFYIFAQSPQGQETKYIGEFRATAVEAAQTALKIRVNFSTRANFSTIKKRIIGVSICESNPVKCKPRSC